MVETTVSATAVRRLAVAAQSYSGRYRRAKDSSVEAAIRRLSCVQLDSISTVERSHRIALTSRDRQLSEGERLAPARPGPDLRVLGARGMSAADRVVAALPPRDDERRPRLVQQRQRRQGGSSSTRRRDPRAHPRGRPARVPAVRGGGRRRHVELEAREGNARAALEPRRARDLGTPGLPARLRPRRARDPAGTARRAGTSRRRGAQDLRRAGGAGSRSVDRGRDRGALAAAGRHRRFRPAVAELVAEGRLRRLRVDDGGPDVLVSADAELDRPPRAPRYCSRRSTTCSGTAPSRDGSWASTT